MSTEKLKKKISIISQMISVLQKMLVLISNKPVIVIAHHTSTSQMGTSFRAINQNHRLAGYPRSKQGKYCAYNTLITGNGERHIARSYQETGHAVRAFTGFHLDIALCGNFMDVKPTTGQLRALENELAIIKRLYGSYDLKVHKDFTNTLCCGKNLIQYINDRK